MTCELFLWISVWLNCLITPDLCNDISFMTVRMNHSQPKQTHDVNGLKIRRKFSREVMSAAPTCRHMLQPVSRHIFWSHCMHTFCSIYHIKDSRIQNNERVVSVCVCSAGSLPVRLPRHSLSSRQLFVACGGIPSSASRHSLSPAYFMGRGGRAGEMVFLRNYYALIHSEGVCAHSHSFLLTGKWHSGLPYRGSVWKTEGREGGREGGEKDREWLMGDVKGGGI